MCSDTVLKLVVRHACVRMPFLSTELNMSDVTHFISHYGYWAMFFGALIEGETFLLAGGIAAKHGLLHLPGLIGMAILGAYLHDNFFFFLGRIAGRRLLALSHRWQEAARKSEKLFNQYGIWLVASCRYFYGLRTIIPTVIGMSNMSTPLFLLSLFTILFVSSATMCSGRQQDRQDWPIILPGVYC